MDAGPIITAWNEVVVRRKRPHANASAGHTHGEAEDMIAALAASARE